MGSDQASSLPTRRVSRTLRCLVPGPPERGPAAGRGGKPQPGDRRLPRRAASAGQPSPLPLDPAAGSSAPSAPGRLPISSLSPPSLLSPQLPPSAAPSLPRGCSGAAAPPRPAARARQFRRGRGRPLAGSGRITARSRQRHAGTRPELGPGPRGSGGPEAGGPRRRTRGQNRAEERTFIDGRRAHSARARREAPPPAARCPGDGPGRCRERQGGGARARARARAGAGLRWRAARGCRPRRGAVRPAG